MDRLSPEIFGLDMNEIDITARYIQPAVTVIFVGARKYINAVALLDQLGRHVLDVDIHAARITASQPAAGAAAVA